VLTISTDALGKVPVHWGQIEGLESPRLFVLRIASGDRYYGPLLAAKASEVTVGLGGGASTTVALADVIELVPVGRSFWSRIDGTLDVGFTFTQANLETHATLNGSATYRAQMHQFGVTFGSQVTTREDVDREYRADVNANASRYLSRRWFGIGWGAFQQNDELSLEVRVVGGAGMGHEFVHTNRRLWSIFGGAAYTRELYVDEPIESSVEAAVGGQLDFFSPGSDDYSITNRVVTYYNVSGRARTRIELQSAWRQEFLADFYWSLNGFESFDSDPPADEKHNDSGVSFTIGWKF
jgi:hypothetical protein